MAAELVKSFSYHLTDVAPYINWLYFYHAWGVGGRPVEDKQELRAEAEQRMAKYGDSIPAYARFRLLDVHSDGDDIIASGGNDGATQRIAMLRQQHGNTCYCLSDFISPKADKLGLFATTVHDDILDRFNDDPYERMMMQLILDRLAEATAEKLHEQVRKDASLWGYAPDENLTIQEMQAEKWQGIRPAVGYPSLPDQSMNFTIGRLLHIEEIGITLTSSGAMQPHSSVSGFMFAHPQSRYFSVGKISEEQLNDYAHRRNLSVDDARRFLAANL